MWLRGATSSLLVSFLFAFAYFWFVENQSFSQAFQENLIFNSLLFSWYLHFQHDYCLWQANKEKN